MPSEKSLLVLLIASVLTFLPFTLAQTSSYPPCVRDCITNNPGLSWCDGDETGQALDECTCASYSETDPLIICLRQCTPSEQGEFAGVLPDLCRDDLLPDAEDVGEGETAGDNGNEVESATSTESVTSTPGPTPTVGSDDNDAQETGGDTETDAAVAMGVPEYAIVGGLLIALAL
ncbi:hypothetical protein BDV19DRAFT_355170 [Aspergillus venezuelensis]